MPAAIVKGRRNRATRIAGGGDQNMQTGVDPDAHARATHAAKKPRAKVLERRSGPVKEFKHVRVGPAQRHERCWEVQRVSAMSPQRRRQLVASE